MRSTRRDHGSTLGFVIDHPRPLHPIPRPRGIPTGAVIGIIVGALALLMCAGITIIGAVGLESAPRTADTDDAGAPAPWTPEPEKTLKIVQLGDTLIYTSSGTEVRYTVSAGKNLTQTRYGTRPEKGAFFALAATIQVTRGSTYACGCDFALIAADGTAYEPTAFGFDGQMDAVQLSTGQKAAGLVVWDVPSGAVTGAKVELRANLFTSSPGFWQLP